MILFTALHSVLVIDQIQHRLKRVCTIKPKGMKFAWIPGILWDSQSPIHYKYYMGLLVLNHSCHSYQHHRIIVIHVVLPMY